MSGPQPRVVLDACVLYPTVLRKVLLGVAAQGLFQPLWSVRLLEEWARAAARMGAGAEAQARREVEELRRTWPLAELKPAPGIEARLWLPDPADCHVLAVAIAGSADRIVTFNAADFPRGLLAAEGVSRCDPDQLLCASLPAARAALAEVAEAVRAEISQQSGECWPLRKMLRRAGLPKLGKALAPPGA